jgi:hypothetical protein
MLRYHSIGMVEAIVVSPDYGMGEAVNKSGLELD